MGQMAGVKVFVLRRAQSVVGRCACTFTDFLGPLWPTQLHSVALLECAGEDPILLRHLTASLPLQDHDRRPIKCTAKPAPAGTTIAIQYACRSFDFDIL
jgi:hypothetical protein